MSIWRATQAKRGWPGATFSCHDNDEAGPAALAKIAEEAGLRPEDL